MKFEAPKAGRVKRYLLRLINTSFESTFVFSIDNHNLQIVGADFVPIHPYKNETVTIGIGQRYHVIVEAKPNSTEHPIAKDGNYWIRTWRAKCFQASGAFEQTGGHNRSDEYMKTGILRYYESDANPTTSSWNAVDLTCYDERYDMLRPILPWTVGPAANNQTSKAGEVFPVEVSFGPNTPNIFPLAHFSMGGDEFQPLQIDYGDPTFLKLDYQGKWNPNWVIIPEDYKENDWVRFPPRSLCRRLHGATS